jgi:hypothetical protein
MKAKKKLNQEAEGLSWNVSMLQEEYRRYQEWWWRRTKVDNSTDRESVDAL